MINFLCEKGIKVTVYTYENPKKMPFTFHPNAHIKYHPFPNQQPVTSSVSPGFPKPSARKDAGRTNPAKRGNQQPATRNQQRILRYLTFNLITLLHLIKTRPSNLLYYEPHGALPVYWYYRLTRAKTRLFIHHHEYYSPAEYNRKGMRLARTGHRYEKKMLFKKAYWISQTNAHRLKFMQLENPHIDNSKWKVMPNYPPPDWPVRAQRIKSKKTNDPNQPEKLIYIGALSLQNTYIREMCHWVIQQNGKYTLTLISANIQDATKAFLEGLNAPWIRLNANGVPYQQLPEILAQHDTGLILYKSYSPNVVFCIPNKFYEYLVCGLNIWFPKELKLLTEYFDVMPNDPLERKVEGIKGSFLEALKCKHFPQQIQTRNFQCDYQNIIDNFKK